jgi:hypothetical protein
LNLASGPKSLPRGGLQRLELGVVCRPDVLMFRGPRRKDHTIWTAIAPNALFTVRAYATRRDHEPRLSAQVSRIPSVNLQLTALRPS